MWVEKMLIQRALSVDTHTQTLAAALTGLFTCHLCWRAFESFTFPTDPNPGLPNIGKSDTLAKIMFWQGVNQVVDVTEDRCERGQQFKDIEELW